MRAFIYGFLIFVFLFFFANKINAQEEPEPFNEEMLEGEVVQILEEREYEVEGLKQTYQKIRIFVTRGSLKDRTVEIENGGMATANSQKYKTGDKIMLTYAKDQDGKDLFFITDFVRREGLWWLFGLFVVLTIVVGRFWGAASLLGMGFSFLVIFKFILPQILDGKNPVLIAIAGSAIIIPVTFGLSHGLKKKTAIAALGTILTLLVIGLLTTFFVDITHLTGFSAEEASFLQFDFGNVLNIKGILLAGIIIASLGILDDITISQASVVNELKEANKSYGFGELFQKGMNVGRDHIASLVNTLVLVYTGASLPLFLLLMSGNRTFSEVVSYEIVAEEIVRTLVGSIGLVLAVPITTFLAAFYSKIKLVQK